jgi:hypothetical protein
MKKDINCLTSRKTDKPVVGEIFFGESEFIIGRKKSNEDSVIEVAVTKEQCIKESVVIEQMLSKGKLFTFPKKIQTDISVIDKTRKNATFVVESVETTKELELLHSVLPASYLIRARRLKDSKYDPNGEVIEFYTCGRFENTYNGYLEVIGKLSE